MGQIRCEINDSFPQADSNCNSIVTVNDVISVIHKVNSGKAMVMAVYQLITLKTPAMICLFMCHFYSHGCLFMVLCQMIYSLVMLYRFLKVEIVILLTQIVIEVLL